jgi:hypothetical protein
MTLLAILAKARIAAKATTAAKITNCAVYCPKI